MAKYIRYPFAENGDRTEVPDTSAGDQVNYEAGYTPAYELPKENPDRRNIDRGPYNQLLFDITQNIKQWQDQAFPEIYDDDGTGSPPSYPVGFIGRYGGVYYQAVADGTTTVPPSAEWDSSLGAGQNIAVFDTAGVTNWDVPAVLQAGLRKAKVTVVGGGASGGRNTENGATGGASGGYAEDVIDLSDVTSITITVGERGESVSSGSGVDGGSSSFGTYTTCEGGQGGSNSQQITSTGGEAVSTNGITVQGGYGLKPQLETDAGGENGGPGGGNPLGEGGAGGVSGRDGTGYGSGGGGSSTGDSGAGRNGIVIVEW